MGRSLVIIAAALALFAGAVWYALHKPRAPEGYSGLEFARLTAAAASRTPLRAQGGALVLAVAAGSPADKAGIKPGEVAAEIGDTPLFSARQASDLIKVYRVGEKARFTLYDVTQGEIHPAVVDIVLAAPPDPQKTKSYSVEPPRTLAKDFLVPPAMAANAAWSQRIARGPTIRPLALTGLGAGRCNGLAPERWRVAGHAADDSMFHVMAEESFAHAVYQSTVLGKQSPVDFIRRTLAGLFGAPAVLTPAGDQPYGFGLFNFGNTKGGVGFVEYRVAGGRIQLWIAAVPGADAAWAEPLTGAVVFSLNCGAPAHPRDPALAITSVSGRCLGGACEDSDFAAAYMKTLRLGYVHDGAGNTYLVNPRRDYWIDGSDGPGFYHQIGGENEKLEPGRSN